MTPYFADSYYYIALLNPSDEDHTRVVAFTRGINRPVVTTTWVLTEVGDAFAQPRHRPAFLELLKALATNESATVVEATQELFDRGVELYRRRPDQEWPLTDCISFAVMQEYTLRDALTGDHHFEQAGFIATLK